MNINLFLLVLLALVLSPGEADVLSEESVKACLEEHNKCKFHYIHVYYGLSP